jgi:hypothetical protein
MSGHEPRRGSSPRQTDRLTVGCNVTLTTLLGVYFLLVAYLDCSSTLWMETVHSSETSVNLYRTLQRHIPEDSIFHGHRCENLNFSKFLLVAYSRFLPDLTSPDAVAVTKCYLYRSSGVVFILTAAMCFAVLTLGYLLCQY